MPGACRTCETRAEHDATQRRRDIDDAVSLYVKFTDVDPEVARQVVEKLAEG